MKATNYSIKNNHGKREYWLSFDGGKTWRMTDKKEFYNS